ncbi:MAG: zinc ribbon domain-containing protein, partial [Nitrospinae bacterium]|nr:zinc ribbon domain-containing protein [Nitrospinota bacterium]
MPIYEYQCQQCKKHTEALQKTDDPPLDTCEHCGGKLQKTISNSTFHLYGPGFH